MKQDLELKPIVTSKFAYETLPTGKRFLEYDVLQREAEDAEGAEEQVHCSRKIEWKPREVIQGTIG